jgi:hypothetical protein
LDAIHVSKMIKVENTIMLTKSFFISISTNSQYLKTQPLTNKLLTVTIVDGMHVDKVDKSNHGIGSGLTKSPLLRSWSMFAGAGFVAGGYG